MWYSASKNFKIKFVVICKKHKAVTVKTFKLLLIKNVCDLKPEA